MHNRQKQLYCGRSFALDLSLLNANSRAPLTALSNDRGRDKARFQDVHLLRQGWRGSRRLLTIQKILMTNLQASGLKCYE